MTPTDFINWMTVYRNGAAAILGPTNAILGTVSTARLNLDLIGVVAPFAVAPTVTKGPNMPAPDQPSDPGTGLPKPTWGAALGECKKFDHPNKLLAVIAAFQHLQACMGEDITFTGYDGQPVTMLAGSALSAVV